MKISIAISSLLLLLFVLTISFTSCTEPVREKTEWELKQDLKRLETSNPLKYLSDAEVTLKAQRKKVDNGGLFRDPKYVNDGALISGYIKNTATIAEYKDVVVRVKYFSQTKSLITSKSFTIYKFFKPHSSTYISIKDYPPKSYKTFSMSVQSAIVSN